MTLEVLVAVHDTPVAMLLQAKSYGPVASGALFGAGWWFWVDAVVCTSHKIPFDQVRLCTQHTRVCHAEACARQLMHCTTITSSTTAATSSNNSASTWCCYHSVLAERLKACS